MISISPFKTIVFFCANIAWICSAESTNPIFNNTLTLEQFGSIANNLPTFQPANSLVSPITSLRTNDYQNLQLNYDVNGTNYNYGSGRNITRIGPFLVSQQAQGNMRNEVTWPGGPGLSVPTFKFTTPDGNPGDVPGNPAQNIVCNVQGTLLVFSAVEALTSGSTPTYNFGLSADMSQSTTGQAAILTYTDTNTSRTITDYNIIGNAYHDILYDNLTPVIWADVFTSLYSVAVYSNGVQVAGSPFVSPVPPVGYLLPAGDEFVITFMNTQTSQMQTWILFLQPDTIHNPSEATFPQVQFYANFNLSFPPTVPANEVRGTVLQAKDQFTGFLRLAVIQAEAPVPYNPAPNSTATEVYEWSTALGIQTIAPAGTTMFMLWPVEFAQNANAKIKYNFANSINLPYCPWLSIYLPLVAETDFTLASGYFYHLMQDIAEPLYPFDGGTNPFLAYFHMLLANTYASSISSYQTTSRPFPVHGITPTAATVRTSYETYRDAIPINAELSFGSGNTYKWSYTTTARSGASNTQPLIVFPGYKTLNSPSTALAGFAYQDPVKGPLYATVADNTGSVNFIESPLPDFVTANPSNLSFLPADFYSKLSSSEVSILLNYWTQTFTGNGKWVPASITSASGGSDAYGIGKILYQAALSTNYAAYLMTKGGTAALTAVNYSTLNSVMEAIKGVFSDWLIDRQAAQGGSITASSPNFFIGDNTVGGICYSVADMVNGVDSDDFGNAAYNDHHFAHGYWLGAAGQLALWDNLYGPSNGMATPWIATTKLSGTGSGPYKMKAYVDMLWRDTVNPDMNDPVFPFHRHGHPWEGHSTANGLTRMPYSQGRNQESLAEDFNCWLGTLFYANAILNTNSAFPNALTADDTQGFSQLMEFCATNLSMTATGGNLYYNTSNWPYANLGTPETSFNFNVAVGNQFDIKVDTNTYFAPGTPPCGVSSESVINSQDRQDDFYDSFLE